MGNNSPQGDEPISSPIFAQHDDVVSVVMLRSVDQLQQAERYLLTRARAEELAAIGAARIVKPPVGPKEFKQDEPKPSKARKND